MSSRRLDDGSGLISYGVEKMGGVAGDWGERLLGKIAGTGIGQKVLAAVPDGVKSFISGLSQNKVMQILGDGLSEGAEEWTEYDLQRMFKNLVLDEDTPFDVKEADISPSAMMSEPFASSASP